MNYTIKNTFYDNVENIKKVFDIVNKDIIYLINKDILNFELLKI